MAIASEVAQNQKPPMVLSSTGIHGGGVGDKSGDKGVLNPQTTKSWVLKSFPNFGNNNVVDKEQKGEIREATGLSTVAEKILEDSSSLGGVSGNIKKCGGQEENSKMGGHKNNSNSLQGSKTNPVRDKGCRVITKNQEELDAYLNLAEGSNSYFRSLEDVIEQGYKEGSPRRIKETIMIQSKELLQERALIQGLEDVVQEDWIGSLMIRGETPFYKMLAREGK